MNRLEDVLAAHQYDYPDLFCECGAYVPKPWTGHPAHVAAAVREHLTSDAAVERAARALATENAATAKYRDMPDAGWLPMFARAALTAALEADNHDPRS